MNKELNLCVISMHSKPRYKVGKKHKIFDNPLNQNFIVDCKNKVWCTTRTMSPMMVSKYQLHFPSKAILQKKLQELVNIPTIE